MKGFGILCHTENFLIEATRFFGKMWLINVNHTLKKWAWIRISLFSSSEFFIASVEMLLIHLGCFFFFVRVTSSTRYGWRVPKYPCWDLLAEIILLWRLASSIDFFFASIASSARPPFPTCGQAYYWMWYYFLLFLDNTCLFLVIWKKTNSKRTPKPRKNSREIPQNLQTVWQNYWVFFFKLCLFFEQIVLI